MAQGRPGGGRSVRMQSVLMEAGGMSSGGGLPGLPGAHGGPGEEKGGGGGGVPKGLPKMAHNARRKSQVGNPWADSSIAPLSPEAVAHRVHKANKIIEEYVLQKSQHPIEKVVMHADSLPATNRHTVLAKVVDNLQRVMCFNDALLRVADVSDILDSIQNAVRATHEALGADYVAMHTNLTTQSQTSLVRTLRLLSGYSTSVNSFLGNEVAPVHDSEPGKGLVGQCFQLGQPILVPNLEANPTFDEAVDTASIPEGSRGGFILIPAVNTFGEPPPQIPSSFGGSKLGKGKQKKPPVHGVLVAAYDSASIVETFDNEIGMMLLEKLGAQIAVGLEMSMKHDTGKVATRQLNLMYTLMEGLKHSKNLKDCSEVFATHGHRLVGAKWCALHILDTKDEKMWHIDPSSSVEVITNSVKMGITGHCIKTGQIIVLKDMKTSELFHPVVDGRHMGSIMCIPIKLEAEEIVAVLTASGKAELFSRADSNLMNIVASKVQSVIKEERLRNVAVSAMDASISARSHQNALLEGSQADVGGVVDPDKILRERMEPAVELLMADRVTVFIVDHQNQELVSKFRSEDLSGETVLRVPLGKGFASHCAITSEHVVIKDAYEDERFNQDIDRRTGYRTTTVLVVPVLRTNRGGKAAAQADSTRAHPDVIGVVQMINKHRGAFTADDIQVAESFAASAAGVIESSIAIDDWKKQVERAQKRSNNLLKVGKSLSNATSTEDISKLIMTSAKELLEADRCTLYLWDETHTNLQSYHTDASAEMSITSAVGIAGYVATSGEVQNLKDVYSHPKFNAEYDKVSGYRTVSMLCMPILGKGGKIWGVIQMINKGPQKNDGSWNSFTEADEEVLAAFASQAAVSFENSEVSGAIAKANLLNKGLMNVSMAVTSQRELKDLFPTIMGRAQELLEVDRCTLFLLDEEKDELWSLVANGEKEIRTSASSGLAGAVATTAEVINIKDAYLDYRFNPEVDKRTGYRTKSVLAMPILSPKNKTVGVIQMINKLLNYKAIQEGRETVHVYSHFSTEDEEILETLVGQVAIAIENTKLLHEVVKEKETLKEMVDSAANMLILFKKDGTVDACNGPYREMFGLDEAEEGPYSAWMTRAPEMMHDVEECFKYGLHADYIYYNIPLGDGMGSTTVNYFATPLMEDDSVVKVQLEIEIVSARGQVMRTMRGHLPQAEAAEVADQVEEKAAEPQLARADETGVLISNIRDFNKLGLGPKETISFLNRYFGTMAECIEKEHGLDKYVGDEILAWFGPPLARPPHEICMAACRSALAMRRQLQRLIMRSQGSLEPFPSVDLTMGIHLGEATSGLLQVGRKVEHTICGAAVNVADVCEQIARRYLQGTGIVVSDPCYELCSKFFVFRELDRLKFPELPDVPLLHSGLRFYELLAESRGEMEPSGTKICNHYKDGLAHYKARRWRIASEQFKKAFEMGDRAANILFQRCKGYVEDPLSAPKEDWDGFYASTLG